MSATYHDEAGHQWTVDEIAPGGAGSLSDTGMVEEDSRPASTTLVFRRVPEGSVRIAIDVPSGWRDDKAIIAHALSGSVDSDALRL